MNSSRPNCCIACCKGNFNVESCIKLKLGMYFGMKFELGLANNMKIHEMMNWHAWPCPW